MNLRVTIACPENLIDDANQLALCLGLGPEDVKTYEEPSWQDEEGNYYAVASAVVGESFVEDASSPLGTPLWGADMSKALKAQSLIEINAPAKVGRISAVFGDVNEALQTLGVFRIEPPLA